MGTIALDNGESVYIHDGTGDADPIAISGLEGSNLAALMSNRERFDYTWANATERNAQTGMIQGSRGYQEDTKTEYLYDNAAWRFALPYIEFSGTSLAITSGVYLAQSGWSVDATNSTDTTMVTVSGGVFTFVRPGIYAISVTGTNVNALNAFQNFTTDVAHLNHISIAGYIAQVSTLTIPFYRITAANTPLYLWAYSDNSGNLTNRTVRIGRLG